MVGPSSVHFDRDRGVESEPGRPIAAALTTGVAAGFLLCGYEFVRSVSTSLYIGAYGADKLPIVMALAPVGTFGFLYVYGWLVPRLGPRRTILLTSLLSGLGILACYGAIRTGFNPALGALYVLREGYIVLIIEQYWSFINSTLDTARAKRLNGPVCGIASLGAVSGGLIAGYTAVAIGSEQLLLFAALSLLPAGVVAWWAYGLGGEPVRQEGEPHRGALALGLFRQSRTLVLLALLIATTQVVSTVLDLRFSGLVGEAFPVKDARTAYFGGFYAVLNGTAFFLQFVVAPLALRMFSLRAVHLVIPLFHLATCSVLFLHPTLATGSAAYLTFKVLDYSVFRAGKEIFYIPLSFDARYRAKEVIDAFVYRASKGVTSGLLAVAGMAFGRVSGSVYPTIAMLSAVIWSGLVFGLTRTHAQTPEPGNEAVE